MPIDTEDPRYRCCCGCCRATVGAVLIAVLNLLCGASFIYNGLTDKVKVFEGNHEEAIKKGILINGGIMCAVGLLTILGVLCRVPCLLIFHMIVDILSLFGYGLLAVVLVIVMFVMGSAEASMAIIGQLIGIGLAALIQIWFFMVMLSAYRLLTDESRSMNEPTAYTVGVAAPPPGGAPVAYSMAPTGPPPGAQQNFYYPATDATGMNPNAPPNYTPMLSAPNYYKEQNPGYATSSMYGEK